MAYPENRIMLFDLTESEVSTLPVVSGQYIITRDTGNIYMDTAEGIRINPAKYFAFLETERARKSMLVPEEGKTYYVLDSGYMWVYYAGSWKRFGGANISLIPFTKIEASGWVASGSAFTYTITDVATKYFNTIIPNFDLSVQDLATAANITASTGNVDNQIILTAVNKPEYDLFASFFVS